MGRLVHIGLGSSSLVTCPPLSPSPYVNSFVIDTAVINTRTCTNLDGASLRLENLFSLIVTVDIGAVDASFAMDAMTRKSHGFATSIAPCTGATGANVGDAKNGLTGKALCSTSPRGCSYLVLSVTSKGGLSTS